MIGISIARACLAAAGVSGRLPFARCADGYSEAGSDANRRLGQPHWVRSGMRLPPGVMVTGWSEVSRRVITRIGCAGVAESLVLPTELRLALQMESAS